MDFNVHPPCISKNKPFDAVMENLDLCILQFHYGLHPGHNLRKTAGKSQACWLGTQLL